MPGSLKLLLVTLVCLTVTAHGHEHHEQHSHFCQGGGYSLFCPDNQTLTIDRAWYGRIAHDRLSCSSNSNALDKNDTTQLEPDLDKDCGGSILHSKSSWCEQSDLGGCTIRVDNLAPDTETVPCPANATKYLYLEYDCVDGSGAGAVRAAHGVLLSLLSVVVLWYFC